MVLCGQYFLYFLCYLNLSHFLFVIPMFNELNSDFWGRNGRVFCDISGPNRCEQLLHFDKLTDPVDAKDGFTSIKLADPVNPGNPKTSRRVEKFPQKIPKRNTRRARTHRHDTPRHDYPSTHQKKQGGPTNTKITIEVKNNYNSFVFLITLLLAVIYVSQKNIIKKL